MSPFVWGLYPADADATRFHYVILILVLVGSVPFAYSLSTDAELKDRPILRRVFLIGTILMVLFTSIVLWGQGIERGLREAEHQTVVREGR